MCESEVRRSIDRSSDFSAEIDLTAIETAFRHRCGFQASLRALTSTAGMIRGARMMPPACYTKTLGLPRSRSEIVSGRGRWLARVGCAFLLPTSGPSEQPKLNPWGILAFRLVNQQNLNAFQSRSLGLSHRRHGCISHENHLDLSRSTGYLHGSAAFFSFSPRLSQACPFLSRCCTPLSVSIEPRHGGHRLL